MKRYPVAEPVISSLEKQYVNDCLDSGWVSSQGKYIKKFEEAYSNFNNTKYAITVSNGTVSLHLILLALGIKDDDEVIVPNFTYIAAANAVLYVRARPVFVDCDIETYNIDPEKIEEKITPKTKAILAVHVYGNPCDMGKIIKIAKKYKLYVIEDAAEAHGAKYDKKIVGSFGVLNSFSFFGNKTITTGEGGMITTNNGFLAEKISLLKNQGQPQNGKKYFHSVLGYNYRMTNIQAAIGLAQLKKVNNFVKRKQATNRLYKKYLNPLIENQTLIFQKQTNNSEPSFWMNALTINGCSKDVLSEKLKKFNIETRPFFLPMNKIPHLKTDGDYPQSTNIYKKGIVLPSGTNLTKEDVKIISDRILEIFK